MIARNKTLDLQPGDLFKVFLKDIVDLTHPLVRLAGQVDWKQFEAALAPAVADKEGRLSGDGKRDLATCQFAREYEDSRDSAEKGRFTNEIRVKRAEIFDARETFLR
jgi:hypothetical protein